MENKDNNITEKRLPRNFHQTFVPERLYIGKMLKFADSCGIGDDQKISQETGIPTGESTGKVPAIINYCKGMGMIVTNIKEKVRILELTPFGKVVLKKDPRISEKVTQWIAHFNMCSPITGAESWYHVFMRGRHRLGMKFQRNQLNEFLESVYETTNKNLVGPMIRMYQDQASLGNAGILLETKEQIERFPPPISEEYANAYATWTLLLMENHFPNENQITVNELERVCGWQSISGWSDIQIHDVLSLIEVKGAISVDRQMRPWIIRKASTSDSWWSRIYDDLI
jgi:hypothetical protein